MSGGANSFQREFSDLVYKEVGDIFRHRRPLSWTTAHALWTALTRARSCSARHWPGSHRTQCRRANQQTLLSSLEEAEYWQPSNMGRRRASLESHRAATYLEPSWRYLELSYNHSSSKTPPGS